MLRSSNGQDVMVCIVYRVEDRDHAGDQIKARSFRFSNMAITNLFETGVLLSCEVRACMKRRRMPGSRYLDAIDAGSTLLGSCDLFLSISMIRTLFPLGILLRSGLFSGLERYTAQLCVSWQNSVRAILQGPSFSSRPSMPAVSYEWSESLRIRGTASMGKEL
jgi:hypothetical protein